MALTADQYLRLLERIDLRREQRRSYEWKVTLGLWAGLIAAAKFLADSADKLSPPISGGSSGLAKTILIAAGILVVGGHFAYHAGFVRPAQNGDRDQAIALENKLGMGMTLPDARARGWLSSGFQVAGTFALALLAGLTAWLALFAEQSSKP